MKFKESNFFASLMKFLRPIVIGMIAAAAAILITPDNFIDYWSWALFAGTFIGSQWLKINPILLIIVAGAIGFMIY